MFRLARLSAIVIALAACSACARQPHENAPSRSETGVSTKATAVRISSNALLKLGEPALDLPASRLFERVDGAEVRLRALGCERLRMWPLEEPAAELEILQFASADGASSRFIDEASGARTLHGPGEEAYVGSNVVYFRRGRNLVRVIADNPESAERLMATARQIDAAILRGEIQP